VFVERVAPCFDLAVDGVGLVVVLEVEVEAVYAGEVAYEVVLAFAQFDLLVLVVEEFVLDDFVDGGFLFAVQ
jgi:hypothetical protein